MANIDYNQANNNRNCILFMDQHTITSTSISSLHETFSVIHSSMDSPIHQQDVDGMTATMTNLTLDVTQQTITMPDPRAVNSSAMLAQLERCGYTKVMDNSWLYERAMPVENPMMPMMPMNHAEWMAYQTRLKMCTCEMLSGVMAEARHVLQEDARSLIEIEGKCVVLGKIYGDWHALRFWVERFFSDPQTSSCKLVCLGNYVDGGEQNIAVLANLFALKALYPTKVFLLRGEHEFPMKNSSPCERSMCLLQECLEHFAHIPRDVSKPVLAELYDMNPPVFDMLLTGTDMMIGTSKITEILNRFQDVYPLCVEALELYFSINRCFAWLPLSAIINRKVFVASGGIPNSTLIKGPHAFFYDTIDQMRSIPLPFWEYYQVPCVPGMSREKYHASVDGVFDMIHSYTATEDTPSVPPRSPGVRYRRPITQERILEFLAENSYNTTEGIDLQCIIRSDTIHQPVFRQYDGKINTLRATPFSPYHSAKIKTMSAIVSAEGVVQIITQTM
jgi:Calcineurin-like phosphoesterase